MWRLILRTLLAILFVAGTIISCKKNNADKKTDLLLRAGWKYSKAEQKINSDAFIDAYPTWPACNQDDKYVFLKGNSYYFDEGLTKCNPGDPQVISSGTWSLNSNQTKLSINGQESTIEQLDENTLILSSSYISNPDTNYYRYTFVH